MQLKSILNFVHPIKGFIYEHCGFDRVRGSIEASVRPRRGSKPLCSGCGQPGPIHQTDQEPRRFEFVPLWQIPVVLLYPMRRVDCRRCQAVKVEAIPWGCGKRPITMAYACFLARWAKRLSWTDVARIFKTTFEQVFRSVQAVVAYGLEHRSLEGIEAVGIDEIARRKGHNYFTVVYQLDQGCRRLLHVAEGRTKQSLEEFFDLLGALATSIRYLCSDMWEPYLLVVAERLPNVVHILDRFHIVANVNKAIDKIRAEEHRRWKREGYDVLTKTKWCFLKRKANLTRKQRLRLRDVLRYDLRTVRAYLHARALDALWQYRSPAWAAKFLDAWCARVMRSRLEPLKTVARSLRDHRELILNWFRAKKAINNGIVEGFNGKAKLAFRKSYGFRTPQASKLALYHQLGQLPEPPLTHGFC